MVVAAGLTLWLAPISPPGFQVYPTAPEALKLEVKPGQIAVGVATGFKVGPFCTLTVITAVPVQPAAEPLTV